ncbi:response regulator [Niveispirillum sp. KHB5.9]|uniref:response regulator n=1 Tax=Niveispirillum sp. KHB5.9 TaxID=3400269 RepID=UPI003A8B0129
MPDKINILHLEDSPLDCELAAARLHKAGLECDVTCVEGRRAFVDALGRMRFDVILADFSLPEFDGLSALDIAREMVPGTPFIFLSGKMGEETAVEALRHGARDYVLKERMARLPAAVTRAINEARTLTERHQAEAQFRIIADSMPQLVWSARPDGDVDYFNRNWYDYTGTKPGDSDGAGWARVLHPEDLNRTLARWNAALVSGEEYEIEYRLRQADGGFRWFLGRALPLRDGGRITRWFGTCTDIDDAVRIRRVLSESREELERQVAVRTAELVAANAKLRAEVAEREQAEEALRHAQKMDALGQLTGGIAHDFNNLLTAITGNLELLLSRLETGHREGLRSYAANAKAGATRAAALTQRLLAFARRQPLRPEATHPDALVRGMEDLLRRTVGEQVTIEVQSPPDIWPAWCDANQLEIALLNLVVNARDAMPHGGRIRISATNAQLAEDEVSRGSPAGDYVLLSVGDTGAGMPPDVISRAFDPFFTTKPVGQGTGLGLSQVYGFISQSHGLVRIESTPGKGTLVRLYLPRCRAEQVELAVAPDVEAACDASAGTVLIVEDEELVRMVAVQSLEDAGLRVVEAANGPQALEMLDGGLRVDLMVSDVGLPGMNGRQLAEAARERQPDLRVLFMTGYAYDVTQGTGILGPGCQVLQKPFETMALVGRVTAMLAEPAAPVSAAARYCA